MHATIKSVSPYDVIFLHGANTGNTTHEMCLQSTGVKGPHKRMTRTPSHLRSLAETLWPYPVIGILVILITAPELVQWAADRGWVGSVRWRGLLVQYGAFWPGLLQNWQPNYALQPWAMFITYSFLHGGLAHLLGNLLVLLWVGPGLVKRLGQRDFLAIWILSALGGAIAFALLATAPTPMVGASGSVFGLLGAVVALQYIQSARYWKAAAITLGLMALNVLTLIIENGFLAWQPHLGGYVIGMILGILWSKPASNLQISPKHRD